MSNPTVYRYPKKIVERDDGTRIEIEKSLRQNKDVIVKVKDQMAHTKVVYHLVYDSRGNIVHGPHEEPGSRDSEYREGFPFEEIS